MANRPKNLSEYVGQDRLRPIIDAEMRSGKQFRHTLLFGMPGTGKSSLIGCLGNMLGYHVHYYVASKEWTVNKIHRTLMDLSINGYDRVGHASATADRHILFFDEIHKLPDFESWYPAMEDSELYIGGTPSWLPYWTMVGATTECILPKPFQDRFPLQFTLEPYTLEQMALIIKRSYPKMKDEWAKAIAQRSRGIPRLALSYSESVELMGSLDYFDIMGIDELGLNELDRRYLDALRKGEGRALSLSTLGAMVGEQPRNLASLVEPILLKLGLIAISPKGRVLIEQSGRGRRIGDLILK